jgi:very-short-patch-repair endonuclease
MPGLWISLGATPAIRHHRVMQVHDQQPFSRAEARAAGISAKLLKSARYRRLFYDLYVSAEVVVTPVVRAKAILKICPPGSQASHFTAAELWGAIVPSQPLTHLSCPQPGVRSERRGVRCHRFRGIRISSPEQTFIDLACVLSLVDLVVLGDSLVRARRTTVDRLVDAVSTWSGWGSRPAARAVGFVRKGVDSPMESRLRMLIVLAGLPEPQVNRIVRDGSGNWDKRFDLCYPDLLLIIEYDGRQHADNDEQWDHDIDRREDLDGEGWRMIVIRSKGIYVEPQRTLERIADAMRARGAQNVPTRLRDDWRSHFPGRAA